MQFLTEACLQILRQHYIYSVETNLKVISDPDFDYQLVLQAKQGKVKMRFLIVLKNVTFFTNNFKHRHIIPLESMANSGVPRCIELPLAGLVRSK